jgi:hypothetical protein
VQPAERPTAAQLVRHHVDGEVGVLLGCVADHDHLREALAQDAEGAVEDGPAVDAQEGFVASSHAAVATSGQDHPGHGSAEPTAGVLSHELTRRTGAAATDGA